MGVASWLEGKNRAEKTGFSGGSVIGCRFFLLFYPIIWVNILG